MTWNEGKKNFISFYRCSIILILLAAVTIACLVLIQWHGKHDFINVNEGNGSNAENSTTVYSSSQSSADDYYLFSSYGHTGG